MPVPIIFPAKFRLWFFAERRYFIKLPYANHQEKRLPFSPNLLLFARTKILPQIQFYDKNRSEAYLKLIPK